MESGGGGNRVEERCRHLSPVEARLPDADLSWSLGIVLGRGRAELRSCSSEPKGLDIESDPRRELDVLDQKIRLEV
jgi:hypothetical protein